ncbi:MAG: peptidoglycan-binding protein [Limimaricola soesokkakensis]|uniref:peptidoglycan-binding protein n=1 Tax=Limimaricola soesokkakensis TaxID=1343159 RepID=UPI004058FC58
MTLIPAQMLAAVSAQPVNDNMRSLELGLGFGGALAGLGLQHRLAHFLGQVAHESAGFRYDREVWGPSAAQKRYDTRADLGNTPAADGDGFLFRGRTAIQITGRANTIAFREWCRARFPDVPDFEVNPDAMLSDPWEGLGPIWFWDRTGLNRYADSNDPEMVTRRINGGLNGYQDRLRWYTRAGLVLLGHPPDAVREFQRASSLTIDGIAGPRTRGALHEALRRLPELGTARSLDEPARHPAEVALDRIAAVISEHRGADL